MGKYSEESAPQWLRQPLIDLSRAANAPLGEIYSLAVVPPRPEMGDVAVPMFPYAKRDKQAPPVIAQRVAGELAAAGHDAKAEGPYVNLRANRQQVLAEVLREITSAGPAYGHLAEDPDKVAVLDYSSPNIAKPLAFHHLRSTMIGNSICRILAANGYAVHGVNFLGDWGTQFGYMIDVHEKDDAATFAKLTLDDFVRTYVAQRAAAKLDPSVDDRARAAFLRLEKGDSEARRVWKKARDVSLARFKQVYELLGVHFADDKYIGESAFEEALPGVIAETEQKGVSTVSDGALIVDLSRFGIDTPCLLRKSDGATLYATRDIAAAKFRHDTFGGGAKKWQSLYVVDQGQSLHFKQVFKVIELLGYDWASSLKHVAFGVLLMWSDEEQTWLKGKTRSGNAILLEDVLAEATRRVLAIIDARDTNLPNKLATAQAIGVGAVVFNDLKNRRTNDIKFKFDDALSLEGETGPYIHNALVRTKSILRKAARPVPAAVDVSLLTHPREGELGMILASYGDVIYRAGVELEPSIVARFLLDLAAAFHAFHHDCLVLDPTQPALSDARLKLTASVMQVLENAMQLLGLRSIEAM